MTSVERLFKDLTVLEVANVLAGPAVGMFFAELGATVIKIENPITGGDTTRGWKLPSEHGDTDMSGYFSCINWGKKSIGINFTVAEGRETLLDLVRMADVFLQSFKPGDEQKFRLDYDTLHKINSRLIYAHITAYGVQDDRTGFDAIIQAESGFSGMNGTPESGPVKMPVALIDLLLAHQLKEALLLALIERLQTGNGGYVTVSLLQSGVASLANQATNFLMANIIPQRTGSDHPNIVPYGTLFRTKDAYDVVLAVGTDQQFRVLCEILGIPDTGTDERFSTNPRRVENRNLLKQIIGGRIARMNRDELLNELQVRRVPAGAVFMMDEVFRQPHAQALLMDGFLEDGAAVRGVRSIAFESEVVDTRRPLTPPPGFNQHGQDILRDVLGYTDGEISMLRERGAVA